MNTVTRTIRLDKKPRQHRKAGESETETATGPASRTCESTGRIPRISKLMALAIRFDKLIRDGMVANQSELARLAHVTQPRMTQIMNLLHLAPDIQESILYLPSVTEGRDPITERDVRPITQIKSWVMQRNAWLQFADSLALPVPRR